MLLAFNLLFSYLWLKPVSEVISRKSLRKNSLKTLYILDTDILWYCAVS